jgi:hypothetical protein
VGCYNRGFLSLSVGLVVEIGLVAASPSSQASRAFKAETGSSPFPTSASPTISALGSSPTSASSSSAGTSFIVAAYTTAFAIIKTFEITRDSNFMAFGNSYWFGAFLVGSAG